MAGRNSWRRARNAQPNQQSLYTRAQHWKCTQRWGVSPISLSLSTSFYHLLSPLVLRRVFVGSTKIGPLHPTTTLSQTHTDSIYSYHPITEKTCQRWHHHRPCRFPVDIKNPIDFPSCPFFFQSKNPVAIFQIDLRWHNLFYLFIYSGKPNF